MGWPKGKPRKSDDIESIAIKPVDQIPLENQFIPFGKPDISDQEIQAVVNVLRSGWIGTGKVSRQFEEAFVDCMGGGYAISVSSCSIGLQLALRVSCVGVGDEVLVPPLTFAATVNAVIREGATPVFVDVDDRGCIDPWKMKEKLTNKTRAIIPVHYTGSACDMGYLMDFAKRHDLKVIEDTAHGFGGEYHDGKGMARKLGSIGDFGVFSFYPTKNITSGEGGMVVTRNGELAERMRVLTNQGQTAGAWSRYTTGPIMAYEVIHDGYKGNMPDILASIGLAQIKRWDELRTKRMKIWNIYEDAFGLKEKGHSQHLFTIKAKNRDLFRQKMWEAGIGTGVHYNSLHLEPAYKFLRYSIGDFPMSERISKETVSLPVSSTMTEEDAHRVVKAVRLYKED